MRVRPIMTNDKTAVVPADNKGRKSYLPLHIPDGSGVYVGLRKKNPEVDHSRKHEEILC